MVPKSELKPENEREQIQEELQCHTWRSVMDPARLSSSGSCIHMDYKEAEIMDADEQLKDSRLPHKKAAKV